jgi:hypothetical protein
MLIDRCPFRGFSFSDQFFGPFRDIGVDHIAVGLVQDLMAVILIELQGHVGAHAVAEDEVRLVLLLKVAP